MTGVVTRATKGVPLTATDHDDNLEVIVSLHKSATAPSPTYGCMLWADTDNDLLKMRNKANDAWITLGALDTTGAFSDNNLTDQDQLSELSDVTITSVADNEVLAYDSTASKWINQTAAEAGLATSAQGTLADSALQDGDTVSSLTITSADINGGTIDGVTIGGSSAGEITGTNLTATTSATLQHSSSTKLATTSTGIDVTGTVTADGLTTQTTDNFPLTWQGQSSGATGALYGDGSSVGLFYGAAFTNGIWVNSSGDVRLRTNALNRFRADINGDISFYEDTGTTAKFFWDASAERLGIGTSSPNNILHLKDSDGRTSMTLEGAVTGSDGNFADFYASNDSGNGEGQISFRRVSNDDAVDILFYTSATGGSLSERMRIDSSGGVIINDTSGGTSVFSAPYLHIDCANNKNGIIVENHLQSYVALGCQAANDTGTRYGLYMLNASGGVVGSVAYTSTGTSYNTSSDYRLKEDWQPMSGSIDRLKALNPVNFAWKVDGSRVDGFLAHEAAEVVPEAVTGEKDAVEAIGNVTDAEGTVVQENVPEPAELAEGQTWTKTEDRPVYQGIDQAKLVPLLTAALQEAVSKIEALETRIAALEA